jgi:hypothetical protein
MKEIKFIVYLTIATLSLFILQSSCKKKNSISTIQNSEPTLTTVEVNSITKTTAKSGGNITSDGGLVILEKGLCWSKNTNPTINDNVTVLGADKENYIADIKGLTENTTYYVKAYAKNNIGIGYGNEISFKTNPPDPLVIGQNYQGGLIFYIDGTGLHGMISANSDIGSTFWGCEGTSIANLSNTLGNGLSNTIHIVNNCSDLNSAARFCYDANLNSKTDWYLPSKDELKLIWQNLFLQGYGNFSNESYWSSSQFNSNQAWTQYFDVALTQSFEPKDQLSLRIIPIRNF